MRARFALTLAYNPRRAINAYACCGLWAFRSLKMSVLFEDLASGFAGRALIRLPAKFFHSFETRQRTLPVQLFPLCVQDRAFLLSKQPDGQEANRTECWLRFETFDSCWNQTLKMIL